MISHLQKLFFAFAFIVFASSQIAEGSECYKNYLDEMIRCESEQNLCFRGEQCRGFKDDRYFFFGACVWNQNQAINLCAKKGCEDCKICDANNNCRDVKSMNNTSTMPSTELSSTESNPSEFTSTISTSTPSGAISAFNGPKWESSIPVTILTASAILLTAAIF